MMIMYKTGILSLQEKLPKNSELPDPAAVTLEELHVVHFDKKGCSSFEQGAFYGIISAEQLLYSKIPQQRPAPEAEEFRWYK